MAKRRTALAVRRASGLLALAGLTLVAGCLDNTGVGPSSNIRLVNLINDDTKQPVLVRLDNAPAGSAPIGFLGVTQFSGGSPYASVFSGDHTFTLKWATDTSVIVGQYTVDVPQFTDLTVYATGGGGFETVAFEDDNSAPAAGMVRLKVVNLSPTVGFADVFVTSATADLATATPAAASVPAFEASSSFSVAAGTYRVRVVPTGTAPAARAAAVSVDIAAEAWSSGVRTIVLTDAANGASATGVVITDR